MQQICLVSRELAPYRRGGIGTYVAAAAAVLAEVAEVTVIAPADYEDEHRRLASARDPQVDPRVNYRFVSYGHVSPEGDADPAPDLEWSEAALAAITDTYGTAGPDLVEFCDYRGEAFATVRARARDPAVLARATIAVRAHTSYELCMKLQGTPLPSGHPMAAAERHSLRAADALVWPGGEVLATYVRTYGASHLPRAHRIRCPLSQLPMPSAEPSFSGPLRILYLGRFDRLKGVSELVAGFMADDSDDWRLTMAGGDTRTALGGRSMRDHIAAVTSEDPRIEIENHLAQHLIDRAFADHHVTVIPSRYESWCYVALESLRANRPVLATPVGGLTEVVDAAAGWKARACTPKALREGLAALVASPHGVSSLIATSSPRARFDALTEPEQIAASFLGLAAKPRTAPSGAIPTGARTEPSIAPRRSRRPSAASGVSVIVIASTSRRLSQAVDSASGQTAQPGRILVADQDGIHPHDHAPATGEASGSEFVVVIGEDDILHPEFVAETLAAMESDPGVGAVYTNMAIFGPGVGRFAAIVNSSPLLHELPLPPSEAVVVPLARPGPEWATRLDAGLNVVPGAALLRVAAIAGADPLPSEIPRWNTAELVRQMMWQGWRVEHVPRALGGRRVEDNAEISELITTSALSQVDTVVPMVDDLHRQEQDLKRGRDEAIHRLEQMTDTRWWRIRVRLDGLRRLARLRR